MTLASNVGSRAEPRAALRRLHSATGLFVLGAFLVFHAWQHWPVREGRDAAMARLESSHSAALELVFVLLPLLVHAGLGLRLSRDPSGAQAYLSPALRKFQLGTGLVSAAFIVFHSIGTWLPLLRGPTPIGASYGGLLDQSGSLLGLCLYATGIAAVCTHLGQGAGAALGRLFPERLGIAVARKLGIAVGVLLWLVFLNELASYTTGAPLL